eukprot:11133364-Heterocapsa_arctica.AAC.1
MASSRSIAQGGQGWQKLNRTRRLLCEATEVDLSDLPGNLQHWSWKSLAAHLCSGVLETCQMITDLISEQSTRLALSSASDRMSSWK